MFSRRGHLQRHANQPARRVARRRRGFTLIEAALTTIIIGVGVSASMQLFAVCSQENRISNQMTTAMMLAINVQEAMAGLAFNDPFTGKATFGLESGQTIATADDVDDFDGRTFSPPIDSLRGPIASLSQFSQVVSVMPVYPNKLSANTNAAAPEIAKATYTGAVRVRVRVLFRAKPTDVPNEVYRASWIRADK